jgi:hypothetical protein
VLEATLDILVVKNSALLMNIRETMLFVFGFTLKRFFVAFLTATTTVIERQHRQMEGPSKSSRKLLFPVMTLPVVMRVQYQ